MNSYDLIQSSDELKESILKMMSAVNKDAASGAKPITATFDFSEDDLYLLTITVTAHGWSTPISLEDCIENFQKEIDCEIGGQYECYVQETLNGLTMTCKILIEAAPQIGQDFGY